MHDLISGAVHTTMEMNFTYRTQTGIAIRYPKVLLQLDGEALGGESTEKLFIPLYRNNFEGNTCNIRVIVR